MMGSSQEHYSWIKFIPQLLANMAATEEQEEETQLLFTTKLFYKKN